MKRFIVIFFVVSGVFHAGASWYWPFGQDDDEKTQPRISDLMEPASRLIDLGCDYADEGKVAEAIAEFNKALDELARIELENPDRAAKPEFATVRNKRAYVESMIDTLLLSQAQQNSKAVAVTDTTALEKKFAEEKAARAAAKANRGKTGSSRGLEGKPAAEQPTPDEDLAAIDAALAKQDVAAKPEQPASSKPEPKPTPKPTVRRPAAAGAGYRAVLAKDPKNRKARMMMARDDLAKKDYASAKLTLKELLQEKPNDAAALNLRAMVEKASGDVAAAENTLTQLITSNPQVYYGFYNLAKLILETRGEAGKDAARRYYRNGRDYCGGPVDPYLEEKLK